MSNIKYRLAVAELGSGEFKEFEFTDLNCVDELHINNDELMTMTRVERTPATIPFIAMQILLNVGVNYE